MPDEKVTEITPNSDQYKKEQKKAASKKIVQHGVHQKTSALDRAKDEIVSEDAGTVREYLIWDVLVPAVKNTLADLGHEAVNLIFGKAGGRRYDDRDRTYVNYDRPSYNSSSRSRYDDRRDSYSSRNSHNRSTRRNRHDFDRVVFENRRDAENVFDELVESTVRYGFATVADFYECAGMDTNYLDFRWGWFDLSRGGVERVRDGYVLHLPSPKKVDDDPPFD